MTDYLSYSQISMFLKCGEQYRRRYVLGEIIPPSIAMLKGGSVHKGIEYNHRYKLEHGTEAKKKDVVEVSLLSLDRSIADGGTSEPIRDANKLTREIGDICDYYVGEVSPTYMPKLVEQTFEYPITPRGNKKKMVAILDCVDTNNKIIDYKISRRILNVPANPMQLVIYYSAMVHNLNQMPSGVQYNTIIHNKSGTKMEIESYDIGWFDGKHDSVVRMIDTVAYSIEAGIFTPASPLCWWCSEKMCGYYKTCRYREG